MLVAIGGILIVLFYLGGFHYVMKKFFGVELTSRSNYNNAIKNQHTRETNNYRKIHNADQRIVRVAISNLEKKKFALTSDNIVEEIVSIQSRGNKY